MVRNTEELDVIGCLSSRGYCPIQRAWVLRGVFRDATDAFLAELDIYARRSDQTAEGSYRHCCCSISTPIASWDSAI
ncbi:hypothetical protein [Bradyrhizobium sp.]|uniref:hypothetical protein n=1 Tax=Bradyrhizobium sp. TaxID=376 RepID=UPI00262C79FA|nr:hypothetical protein [Bradyrhizobium sp.]